MTALTKSAALPGFTDPPYDSRAVRDCVQDALMLPGRMQALPQSVLAPLLPPASAARGVSAVALAQLRGGSLLWLAGWHAQQRFGHWLVTHTGALPAPHAGVADLAVVRACEADADLLGSLPERGDLGRIGGATLLIDTPELRADPPLPRIEPGDAELTPRVSLSGHGMDRPRMLAVGGLSRHFWRARAARQANARFGVDILLVCGHLVCAIPAGTHVMPA